MSYELCKRIVLNEKENKIMLTTASNNVRPITYSTFEFCGSDSYKNYTFRDKLLCLFTSMEDGSLQISTINENTEKFEYAMIKVNEYLKTNNINSYTDLYEKRGLVAEQKRFTYANLEMSTKEDYWERSRENYKIYSEWLKTQDKEQIRLVEDRIYLQSLWDVYADTFKIFLNALNENFEGDYNVIAYGCYPINKLGRYDRGYSRFYYGGYTPLKMSYKKAYILVHYMNDDYKKLKIEKVI